MEKIDKNVKDRKAAIAKKNNKKNYNLHLNPALKGQKKGKGKTKGGTAARSIANSVNIVSTIVKDPNSQQFNRFVVVTYPAKGIDQEILGPFDTIQECVHAALEYVKPLLDNETENVFVRGLDGTTHRYAVDGGKIQHV